jgi:2,4-dienoyl-CoA reductase-like NADH-dependent reductase (Old Yellow Enzyme family)/NADPH-dependent 2,4-dienoyl-CoA reductase/sulfur reductase-like enzyme
VSLNNLLSPIKLGDLEISNRVVMAPMGGGDPSTNPDETFPKKVLRFTEERAIGGVGLIITPFCRVDKLASVPIYGIYDDHFIPTHMEFVERVHKHGSKVFNQIALMGGKPGREAPSSIYSINYYERPRELTIEEMDRLVQSFIDAAGRSLKAGYDGVEVHGGHSYFIGATMSPALNKRTDKYGGTFDKMMKFVTDVIIGIKEKYPRFPVGFKFSAYEEIPGGVDIELGQRIAQHIASLGVEYLHVSSESSTLQVYSRYPCLSSLYSSRNALVPLAAEIKKLCPNTAILATGGIDVPEEAEEFIASGKCDMVVLGRAMLADPHWVINAKEGKPITPCIRCMVCYSNLFNYKELECSLNPYLFHEAEQDLSTPARIKDVMIIGAGPAGIRCALTASKRGHNVTLYEKKSYIGGMMYPGSQPNCKQEIKRAINYFEEELNRSNVKLVLNTKVGKELIDKQSPDVLVVASGGEPIIPDIEGISKPHVSTAIDVLTDISKYHVGKAVVVGGGDVGCETACHLADNGFNVTIIEKLNDILNDAVMIQVKMDMLNLLEEKKIKVMTNTSANRIIDNGIEVILPNGKQGGLDADLVVIALNQKPSNKFKLAIVAEETFALDNAATIDKFAASVNAELVYTIGDAASIGRIKDAVFAGEEIGCKI